MEIHATHAVLPARERGADACAWRSEGEAVLAVLADGAGSSPEAADAAEKAVELVRSRFFSRPASWTPARALGELAGQAHALLQEESRARFGDQRMIAAFAAVAVEGDRLAGVWAGDARAYLLRDGGLRQLTRDHSDPAAPHLLTRALGLPGAAELEEFSAELRDGDILLLCSDGVWNLVDPAGDLAAGADAAGLLRAAEARAASRRVERDDLSAVVVRLPEVGLLAAEKARNLPVPEALRAGAEVDGHLLERALDPGERTWVAKGPDGARVVMKFAPPAARDSEPHLEAFLREMRHASTLRSEHFVPARIPAAATCRYYLLDFVEAPALETVLKTRRLAPDEGAALALFLADAAIELLRRDLVHGDLKPENVLVVGDPAAPAFRLVDMGSAAKVLSVTSRAGTASYLAPERFHGAPNCEATEVFALGVTVYRALAGRLPYGEIERFQTPQFHPARPLRELNPNVPPWLEAVVMRSIALTPEARHRRLEDLRFDLLHPHEVLPFAAASGDGGARALARYRLGFWIMTGVAILLLVLLVLGRHR